MLPSSYSELPRLAVHCSKVVFKKKKKKKKKLLLYHLLGLVAERKIEEVRKKFIKKNY